MRRFAKAGAITEEILRMRKAEEDRRTDRAIVSEFFNGAPPLTDEEAEALGFTINVNHLFGYREVQDASDQAFALYTKPSTLLQVDLDTAPTGKRTEWGMAATLEASRVLRKIEGFKTDYRGVCGDATLHGEAVFFFPNRTFPLPKHAPLSRMLVPDDSSTDRRELRSFAIEGQLDILDLTRHYKKDSKGWRKAALKLLLEKIYDEKLGEACDIDQENPEELEYRRQENSATGSAENRGSKVSVVYFYQQRCDKPGNPFDLTITLKSKDTTKGDKKDDQVLYESEGIIPSVSGLICPMFMDTIIGGASKWHRVMGVGTLNYQINHAVELLMNRAQQAVFESSMNFWEAGDATTREAAQQILMKHNGILPEGLKLAANRYQPNLAGIMEMVQFYRQAGSKNVRGVTPNNGDKNDQLEVQAMAEMNQGASASNNRTSNWYDYSDRMWTEAFRRLTNPYITKHDPGYSEVMDFQSSMERRGIPLYYLQPANVEVSAVRLVGDGLRSKEIGIATYLTANRAQYAPELQPRITRITTGLMLDDYRLAEELTPMDAATEDTSQHVAANNENAVMLQMHRPVNPSASDIDEIHVIEHFPALEVLIKDAVQYQKAAFTPQQAEAFQAIGAHIMVHIKRIEGRAQNVGDDPDRMAVQQFMEQLNEMAQMGQKLSANMQANQQGEENQMTPAEMAKFQLEFEKLKFNREKLGHSIEKFQRTQNFREGTNAFNESMKLHQDYRQDEITRRDAARGDVELAVKIASAKAKADAPAGGNS